MCEKVTTRGKFEEKHIRGKIMNHLFEKLATEGYDVDAQLDENYKGLSESLLRIFAMAVGSNCEGLGLEIASLMPNKKAVDAAIRYALSKKCTALAEKLSEVAFEKEAETLNEGEEVYSTEPQEFHNPAPSKSSVVFTEKSTEGVLKPKSLKLNRGGHGDVESSDEESEEVITTVNGESSEESEEEEEVTSLKPKAVKLPAKTSLNPFKIAARGAAVKRSNAKDSDEENQNDSSNADAFRAYFKDVRDELQEENEDMDDDELEVVARDGFDSLTADERKQWTKRAMSSKGKQKKIRLN
jgi:hypothetical protein